jgi:hypothetical protein
VGGLRLGNFNYPDKWLVSCQLDTPVKPMADYLLRVVNLRAYRSPVSYDNFIDLSRAFYPSRPNFLYQLNDYKDLDLVRSDMFEVDYREKIAGTLHVDAKVSYRQTHNCNDMITSQTEIRDSSPVTMITHLHVMNLLNSKNGKGESRQQRRPC